MISLIRRQAVFVWLLGLLEGGPERWEVICSAQQASCMVAVMRFIIRLLTTAASLWVAVWLVTGLEFDGEWWGFLIVAAIMGLANAIARPLLTFFSLPLIVLTLGLFLLVVNAVMLQLVVWMSGPKVFDLGLTSTGFFWATFLGSIVVSVAGWVISSIVPDPKK
jgi:putative membrane protein